MSEKFDTAVIGSGPAGYTSALLARKKGFSVVLFEKDKAGGVCLNKGCIPTKTILHCAQLFEEINCGTNTGIFAENISFSFEKIMEHKQNTVEKLRKSLELQLKNYGVKTVNAEAKILDKNTVEAENKIYKCKKIISACGSAPKRIPAVDFDHKFVLSSDDILELKKLPESILIVGSGAIGTEWARILAAFNTDVTVVEYADKLLPSADFEVSKRLERIFKSKKIKFYTSASIEKIENKKVYLTNGIVLEPEIILAAAGRVPCCNENIEGVTYLGDECGSIQLAHFAIKQAYAEINGQKFNEKLVPSVVYGSPEIAWAGEREQDLEQGSYQKSTILVSALGKSHCDNCTEGFIKILSRNGNILGAHIVSKEASALIHQVIIAMQNNISVEKLREVCFAHPTYSEGIFDCLCALD